MPKPKGQKNGNNKAMHTKLLDRKMNKKKEAQDCICRSGTDLDQQR